MGISEANSDDWQNRFLGIRQADGGRTSTLESEVAASLQAFPQRTLPAKLLYDDTGSALFDRICATPEYYPTRTELALLERVGDEIARHSGAETIVELGSGLARKTHVLLQAFRAHRDPVRYVPVDVSESALIESAEALLRRFPSLTVEGLVGDFSRDLPPLPSQGRTLVSFLGGTIGNFDETEAVALLRGLRASMGEGDHLLLGADLVKDRRDLHAAYNDADGLTEAFNRNTLERLRRELGFVIEPEHFRHEAFFDDERSRIEMHLRAVVATDIRCDRLGLSVALEAGDSIRTEISRKFTEDGVTRLLRDSGFEVVELFVGTPPYALALARVGND